MHRHLLWVLLCLAPGACQAPGDRADIPCPTPSPCDEAGPILRSSIPGCASTLEVMARVHPIVFRVTRPEPGAETTADASPDDACAAPEAPLMRAGRRDPKVLAAR